MAKLFSLNYKRNVNYFTDGNPETRAPHILNTVGIGKAVMVTMPNVIGITIATAQTNILAAGFTGGISVNGSGAQTVATQYPQSGALVGSNTLTFISI